MIPLHFLKHKIPGDSMTQVLSHARKVTCVVVRSMRRYGVVFSHWMKSEHMKHMCYTPRNEKNMRVLRLVVFCQHRLHSELGNHLNLDGTLGCSVLKSFCQS